jgi:hypothetical protein
MSILLCLQYFLTFAVLGKHIKTWNRRFFECQGNSLTYTMKASDGIQRGSITLHPKCSVSEVLPSQSRQKNFPLHCFRIKFCEEKENDSVMLAADSAENAHEWKAFVQNAISEVGQHGSFHSLPNTYLLLVVQYHGSSNQFPQREGKN